MPSGALTPPGDHKHQTVTAQMLMTLEALSHPDSSCHTKKNRSRSGSSKPGSDPDSRKAKPPKLGGSTSEPSSLGSVGQGNLEASRLRPLSQSSPVLRRNELELESSVIAASTLLELLADSLTSNSKQSDTFRAGVVVLTQRVGQRLVSDYYGEA